MMNAQKAYRDDKIIVLADTEYFTARNRERNQEKKKLSRIMAMVLGGNCDGRASDHGSYVYEY